MEIICENCKAKLNVPDAKIPQGQRVIITCPKCKNKLTLGAHASKQGVSVSMAEEKNVPEVSKADAVYADGIEDVSLDFYDEGVKLALVMENEVQQAQTLRQAVEELGYTYVSPQNTREAIGKMRFHRIDLVILSDQFDGIELGESPLLEYLNHLPISVRRRIFVVLLGDDVKTMDHMMAFAMSVNLLINPRDLDKLAAILRNAISDHEKFYKVFMDTLTELGKA